MAFKKGFNSLSEQVCYISIDGEGLAQPVMVTGPKGFLQIGPHALRTTKNNKNLRILGLFLYQHIILLLIMTLKIGYLMELFVQYKISCTVHL